MKLQILFCYVALLSIGIMPTAVASPGDREEKTRALPRTFEMLPLGDRQLPDTNVEHPHAIAPLLTQAPRPTEGGEVVQVKGVRLVPIPNGLQVILETATGQQLQVLTWSLGNTLIAKIPNSQLRLPQGNQFRANNPAKDIAVVTVTNLNANSIQVRVTGVRGLPKAEVFESDEQELTFSLTPAPQTDKVPPAPAPQTDKVPPAPAPETPSAESEEEIPSQTITPEDEPNSATETPEEQEEIDILVTGEQEDGYQVPNATTGTRTDTPLRDIPQSIQVIPRQVLEDQQVIRLDEALNNVSGVTLGTTNSNSSLEFTVRGFSRTPTLQDGFRQYSDYQGLPETANLERVEVLKGPASILYGEVQPGGVINQVTKQPLEEPFYSAEFQVGNRGLLRPQIDISGPLTSDGNLLYRLNALYRSGESFTDYEQDFERVFIAPVVSWKIGESTDLTLQLQYANNEAPLDEGLVAFEDRVVDVPFDRITGQPDDVAENEFINVGYNLEHRFSENWKLRNAFRYISQDFLNTGAIPFEFDEVTGIVTRYLGQQDIDTENYSLQTNIVGEFATGSIDHTLLLGVDLNRSEERERRGLDFSTPQPLDIFDPDYGLIPDFDPDELPLERNTDVEVDRLGVYLQDQIAFSDNFKLLAGLRYDTVDQTTTNEPTDSDPTRSEINQNEDALTPRVGVVYQPSPAISVYASYSQSFTPNPETTVDGNPLEPERGEGFEVGVKAELVKDKLSATLAYFDITKQNVATADPNDPFSFVATGEQQSRGVELDVIGEILPGWNIIASYAYIDAEVTEASDVGDTAVGNRLYNTPEHSASLWTTYEIQRGNLQGLGFGVGFNFVGERQGDLANSFEVDSYFITNAAIFYRRDNWRFALNFKNLFDNDYIAATFNRRTSQIEPGDPFTVIGSISVKF